MFMNVVVFSIFFVSATSWLYCLYVISGPDVRLKFPTSLEDIQSLSTFLQETNPFYTFILFSSAYLYKQAFAIPGSVFLNLLSGALFGPIKGFLLCCVLSACGASLCFLISKYVTFVVVERCVPGKVKKFEEMIHSNQSNLFPFLLSLRLFPITPNWLLNMACPITKVPLSTFFLSVLIGLGPYNFLTSQAGGMLGELKSIEDVMSWRIGVGLGLLALGVLGPALIQKKISKKWGGKESENHKKW